MRRQSDAPTFSAIGRKGSISILAALSMSCLIGMIGLGIDAGIWEMQKADMQAVADAMGSSAALAYMGGDLAKATTEARAIAAQAGYVSGVDGVAVGVNSPPLSGNYRITTGAIEIILQKPAPMFFSRLFVNAAPTIASRSVSVPGALKACVIALSSFGVAVSLQDSFALNLSDCDLRNNSTGSNGTYLLNSSSLIANNIILTNNYYTTGSASLTARNKLRTYAGDTVDPYESRAMPSIGACSVVNTTISGGNVTLSPGTYCSDINISGTPNVTFNPGVYILDKASFKASGAGTISGNNVSFVLTSSTGSSYGLLDISGSVNLNLSAPASGPTAGMVFWVDKLASARFNRISGTNTGAVALNGVVYMPTQKMLVLGPLANTSCIQFVVSTISFTGNNTVTMQHSCGGRGVSEPMGDNFRIVE